MNWIGYDQLIKDTLALARRLPRDLVGVLAIPRSGMLPASVIASELGVHLGDVYTFSQTAGTFLHAGRRMDWDLPENGRVLVLDDSVYLGSSIELAKVALRRTPTLSLFYEFEYGAIYVAPQSESKVKWLGKVVPMPRLFEWNWLGHGDLEKAFCDMDGILCVDPSVIDDGGPQYAEALRDAKPLYLPRRPLGAIVTGRLERWRGVTAAWLTKHGVQYHRLIMAPFPTPEERRRYQAPRWKGEICHSEGPLFYIESNPREAPEIAKRAGCPVVCPVTGEVW